jgi:hypothetical protein
MVLTVLAVGLVCSPTGGQEQTAGGTAAFLQKPFEDEDLLDGAELAVRIYTDGEM